MTRHAKHDDEPTKPETVEDEMARAKAEQEKAAAEAAAEKQVQLVNAAKRRLQATWAQHQLNTGGGVSLDRDQAAALYAYVCKLEGKEVA